MAGERKQIRDAVKAAIQPVMPGVEIFSGRYAKRNGTEYGNVFITDGEVTLVAMDGLRRTIKAKLSVGYHKSGMPNDDTLDAMADAMEQAIDDNRDQIARVLVPSGFEYTDQEDEYSGIYLTYSIVY